MFVRVAAYRLPQMLDQSGVPNHSFDKSVYENIWIIHLVEVAYAQRIKTPLLDIIEKAFLDNGNNCG